MIKIEKLIREMDKKHLPKKDRYFKKRGGSFCFLDILCSGCNNYVALYQKDGSGALIRMYLDRIFKPEAFIALQKQSCEKKDLPNLQCSNCGSIIGTPMVYEKENRLAFRLVRGAFVKKNSY